MRRHFVRIVLPSALVFGCVAAARADVIERVVAKVNGQIITLSDFQSRQLAAAQAARVEPANIGTFLRQNNAKILQEAIDDVLIMQRAEETGIKAPAPWVDEAIAGIKKDNNLNTQQEFEEALQREGLTLGELRQNIERGIVKRYVLDHDIRGKLEVSDSDLRAEYEKLKGTEFTRPASVSLLEILIKDDAGGLTRAREVAARAKDGEDFASLAKTYSGAPSKANGGEIGEIARPDMNKELAALTSALPVGGVSDPMPVEGGYRILKVAAKTEASTTPFEAGKERIRDRLMMARFEKAYDDYIGELRKSASVELRVREVPLKLSGPIPESSLLEAIDPGGGPGAPPASAGSSGAPAAAPAGSPRPAPAAGSAAPADDEIRTTPQAAPERVTPSTPTSEPPKPPPHPGA